MKTEHNFEHLPLPLVLTGKPKLNRGGDSSDRTKQNRANRVFHGNNLKHRTSELSRFWKERKKDREESHLPQLQVGIPILLEIDPNSDIGFLKGLGFEIICENPNGFIIVATNDVDMKVFNKKTDEFIENVKARCNTPARIYALCDDSDRVSRILSKALYEKWDTIEPEQQYCVDIGVSCSGGLEMPEMPVKGDGESIDHFNERRSHWEERYQSACKQWDDNREKREGILQTFVSEYDGIITSSYDEIPNTSYLPDSFTTRIQICGKGLKDIILNFPYIFEVCEASDVSCPVSANSDAYDNVTIEIHPPLADDPIIGVIDSGIQEEHKYISPAIIQSESKSFIPGNPSVADDVIGGHGTRVAGAILYRRDIPKSGSVQLEAWIRNIKVLDETNDMPQTISPSKMVEDVVRCYHQNTDNPSKIFNQSIGTNTSCEIKHMSEWAAQIDSQSFHNDVLFIQAVGNVGREEILAYMEAGYLYPEYLKRELCRICDPAQSLQALTVGSLSLSNYETDDLVVLGAQDHISAFSRSGPGIWDVVKPDVVEYGGTLVASKEGPMRLTTPKDVCPELIRKSPEGPAFAQDQVGSSFATPFVTGIAVKIEKLYPHSPALLYRALIAQSARWPDWVYDNTNNYENALRNMGYGIPDIDRATKNDEYRVTLLTEQVQEIGEGEAHVYRIPIPEELSSVGEDYDVLVEITLSYVAEPRRTRRTVKRYLSTWVDWRSSRINEPYDEFARRIFETGKCSDDDDGNFKWMIGDAINHGQINNYSNKNGTLLKDWAIIKSNQLSDAFCIAVRGHKGWDEARRAKYSLVVSFEAISQDVQIYEPIRNAIHIEIDNNEIELEVKTHE